MRRQKNLGKETRGKWSSIVQLSGQVSELRRFTAMAILLLGAARGHADRVVLTDGDIIEGVVTKLDRSAVVLEQSDLSRIVIPRSHIESITIVTPDADVSPVVGGTTQGRRVEENEPGIVPEPASKNEQNVGRFDPKLRELSAKTSRLKEKGWTASVDFSMNSSTGNTDEQTMRFGSHVERALADRKGAMDLSFYHKIKEGKVSDNKVTIGGVRDWLYPESVWFWFFHGRFDYDQFESWRERANAQAGPGYHLIQNGDVTLDLRSGLGPRREWGSANNNLKLEGLVGADFEWKIINTHTLKVSPYFFSVADDLDDYRARISGEWRSRFDSDMNLSFLVGTLYEYQSVADSGKSHGDLRTYLGLRWGF